MPCTKQLVFEHAAADSSECLQAKVKLKKAVDDLAKAESDHHAAHNAINARDKQKKWLKF